MRVAMVTVMMGVFIGVVGVGGGEGRWLLLCGISVRKGQH
jgi:hypothetical protein